MEILEGRNPNNSDEIDCSERRARSFTDQDGNVVRFWSLLDSDIDAIRSATLPNESIDERHYELCGLLHSSGFKFCAVVRARETGEYSTRALPDLHPNLLVKE